ncbi:LysE family translocator [Haloferax sp. MBLA0078]|uniref:LysE family translocator n=1 Tax=Haloferax marinum TaxID=2666143 RepID=A0A6A8G3E4_9EURY|nr:LysE family translocator [Haloferax sp. CBA1150]MRW95694.1 LysE family translocator [Haloferax marinum]
MSFFWQGLVLGFSIAAPVGPIGILCIQRTLSRGRRAGFVSGLGAATADGVYGLLAGLGLTAISSFLVSFQTVIRVGGGLFLLYLGIKTFTALPATTAAEASESGLLSDYASTFVLTLTNPVTILAFVGIFAGVGVGLSGNYLDTVTLVGGVVLGSAAWWFVLSTGVSLFRDRVTEDLLRRVNQLAGGILVGFGVAVFASLV